MAASKALAILSRFQIHLQIPQPQESFLPLPRGMPHPKPSQALVTNWTLRPGTKMRASLARMPATKGAKLTITKPPAATVSIGLRTPRARHPNLRPSARTERTVTASIVKELAVTTEALTSGFDALTWAGHYQSEGFLLTPIRASKRPTIASLEHALIEVIPKAQAIRAHYDGHVE